MNTYIALFRGINVGGNNILPMKALTTLLQTLGCEQVSTYIQSGNVVFRALPQPLEVLAESIRTGIMDTHGFSPAVMLMEPPDLVLAAANNPFPTDDAKALHLFFMASVPAAPDLVALAGLKSAREDFQLQGNVFYLYAPDGVGRSRLVARVEKSLGVPVTARNWNTVNRLLKGVKLLD